MIATMVMVVVHTTAIPFAYPRLETIAKAIGLTVNEGLGAGVNNDSIKTWKGKKVRVCTDQTGAICHIGYSLFSNDILSAYPVPTVLMFIERYALEQEFTLEGKTAAERMVIDNVTMRGGGLKDLKKITANTSFSIDNIPRRQYKVQWNTSDGDLTMTFPADCQLILGGNAIELEERLQRYLPAYPVDSLRDMLLPWADSKVYQRKNMRIKDYGTFLSPLIDSRIYLVIRNGKWVPYRSMAGKVKAVTNMMLTGVSVKELPMRMVLDKYGYKSDTLRTTLKQSLSIFRDSGCKVYVGIKTVGEREVTGTLFMYNEPLGYAHVLPFVFPVNVISGGEGVITSRLYSYIPLQNVIDEFFDITDYKDYDHED